MVLSVGIGALIEHHLAAGRRHLATGDGESAILALQTAIALGEASGEAYFQFAKANLMLGRPLICEEALKEVLAVNPTHSLAAHLLGVVLNDLDRPSEALPWLQKAASELPQVARIQRDLGVIELFLGELAAARIHLTRALELDPGESQVLLELVRMTPMAEPSPEAAHLSAVLQDLGSRIDTLGVDRRIEVLFALAKAHEDQGQVDQAFDCLQRANAAKRARVSYERGAHRRRLLRIAEVFDASLIDRLVGSGVESARPIYIVGMPRSGTTLVEQILGAHPEVHGAGELTILLNLVASSRGLNGAEFPEWAAQMTSVDCAAIGQTYIDLVPAGAPSRQRTTLKRLENFEFLGLIHLCMPNSTIIHCRRDPRDTLFSCYSLLFASGNEWSYDWQDLLGYWRDHESLMTHWKAVLPAGRVLEVSYEDLVGDVEAVSRQIVAHCNVDWDSGCLDFHRSPRPVRTASATQVREPIYSRSIGRWKPFAEQLAPFLREFEGDREVADAPL